MSNHIKELLTAERKIAAVWTTGDVLSVRPDLNDDQAWTVLQKVDKDHDAHHGINWTQIEIAAFALFGRLREEVEDEDGPDDVRRSLPAVP